MMLLSNFTRGHPSVLRNRNMNNFIINKILFVGIYDTFNSIDTKKCS